MPKNKLKLTLLANYDAAHDRISITADKSEKDLADGGLYITLKNGTPSETLIRSRMIAAGIIKQRREITMNLDRLVEANVLQRRDATLLQLLARDRRGILINGERRSAAFLLGAYVQAAPDPRVLVIDDDPDSSTRVLLESVLDQDTAFLNTYGVNGLKQPPVNRNWLLEQAYRMRAELIVQDLHDVNEKLLALPKPPAETGMVILDNKFGLGSDEHAEYLRSKGDTGLLHGAALTGFQHMDLSAAVYLERNYESSTLGFKVREVALL